MMYRIILKFPRGSLAELFSGSLIPIRGKKNGPLLVGSFRTDACSQDLVFGCTDPITKTLGLRVVNALQLGHRIQASNMLYEIGVAGHALNDDDIFCILNYCAKSPNPLFVMETWKVLEEKNIVLSWKCYLLIAIALCNGGYLEEALHMVKFIGEHNRISFMLPLYNCFLSACAKKKDMVLVNQCLELMELQCLGKNEITYSVLLKIAVCQENLSAVQEIWRENCKHYDVNIIFLRRFISSCTRLRDIKSAYKALQHMVVLAFQKDVPLCRTVEGKIYSPQLDIPIPSISMTSAMRLDLHEEHPSLSSFDHKVNMDSSTTVKLPKNHKMGIIKKLLRWSFNDVIHACGHSRNAELAQQLFLQMRNLGLKPSSHTYDGLAKAFMRSGRLGDALELLNVMRGENVEPYDITLSYLSICCSHALDLDLAEDFLNQTEASPFILPYIAFFQACDRMEQPERAVKMFAKMRKLKIKPDIRIYELLLSLVGNVKSPYEKGNLLSHADVTKRINVIEKDMLQNGIYHSVRSTRNLLKALGSEGMVQELFQYLRRAERDFYHNSSLLTDIYNTVLKSLSVAKQNDQAIKMFRNLKLRGIPVDAATYTIMLDCCSSIKCFKSAFAFLSMMIRDGFLPQTVTYTALMKTLMQNSAFPAAFQLLDKALSEGRKPDVILFNTILSRARNKDRIGVMRRVLDAMHREKIQPDPETCNHVFTIYVNRNRFKTAIEALQVLSLQMISLDHSTILDVRREYEHLILSENHDVETQIMQLSEKSYLGVALLNLRWCSVLGYSISWDPDRIPWAPDRIPWAPDRIHRANIH